MKQRRAFDQLTFLQLNQPSFVLRAMERAALVLPLVRKMLLEILFSGVALTSNKESDDE